MSSKFIGTLLFISIFTILTSCTSNNGFVFKYGNAQNENDPRSVSMTFFKEELEKRTDGKITVETYFGGILGTEREMADAVATGALQGTRGGMYEDVSIKFNIMQLPFLLDTWQQATRLTRSSWMKSVAEEGKVNGFHIPAIGVSQGFRAHSSNLRPIQSIEDFSGQKIRVPDSQEVYYRMEIALGANPQGIAQSETYSGLRTGVVEGTTAPPSDIWDRKQYEVLQWITIDRHSTGPDPLMVNLAWYESLPHDLQLIFDETAVDALRYSDELYQKMEEEIIAKLAEQIEVIYPSSDVVDEMRKRTKPVYNYFVERGDYSWDDINHAIAAANQESL